MKVVCHSIRHSVSLPFLKSGSIFSSVVPYRRSFCTLTKGLARPLVGEGRKEEGRTWAEKGFFLGLPPSLRSRVPTGNEPNLSSSFSPIGEMFPKWCDTENITCKSGGGRELCVVVTVAVCMGPGETSRKSRKPHFLVSPPRKKDDDMTTTTTMGSPLLSSPLCTMECFT